MDVVKKIGYRGVVNRNMAILAVAALVFFGIGCVKLYSVQGADNPGKACAQDFDNMTQTECAHFYTIREAQDTNAAHSDALFCYAICALLLIGGFVYRGHVLADKG